VSRYTEAWRVFHDGMAELGFEILVPGAGSNILITFRLTAGVGYDTLHDVMRRRGCIIYAGQGDVRTYAFGDGPVAVQPGRPSVNDLASPSSAARNPTK